MSEYVVRQQCLAGHVYRRDLAEPQLREAVHRGNQYVFNLPIRMSAD